MSQPISDQEWEAFSAGLRRLVEAVKGWFDKLRVAFPGGDDLRRQIEDFGAACKVATAAQQERAHQALLFRRIDDRRPRHAPRALRLVSAPAWTTSLRAFSGRS